MNEIYRPQEGRTIQTITGEILALKQTAGAAILDIGRRLIEAKELLSHGEWLAWLAEQVEFSERTAQNFMRLAKEWSNPQALADLGATKALALLALPAEEREAFLSQPHLVDGEEREVIDMTTRQLEQAIRDRDQARAEAEEARAEVKLAAEAREKMAADVRLANELVTAAQEEKRAAEERAAELSGQLAQLQAAPVEVAVMEVDQAALDRAREEGAAALRDKLDRAQAARERAEKKQRAAEEALTQARGRLEQLETAERKAVLGSDRDLAQFEVFFLQGQEIANKLHGLLLKARGREDQAVAEGMSKSLKALGEAIGRCAQ